MCESMLTSLIPRFSLSPSCVFFFHVRARARVFSCVYVEIARESAPSGREFSTVMSSLAHTRGRFGARTGWFQDVSGHGGHMYELGDRCSGQRNGMQPHSRRHSVRRLCRAPAVVVGAAVQQHFVWGDQRGIGTSTLSHHHLKFPCVCHIMGYSIRALCVYSLSYLSSLPLESLRLNAMQCIVLTYIYIYTDISLLTYTSLLLCACVHWLDWHQS